MLILGSSFSGGPILGGWRGGLFLEFHNIFTKFNGHTTWDG